MGFSIFSLKYLMNFDMFEETSLERAIISSALFSSPNFNLLLTISMLLTSAQLPFAIFKYLINCLLLLYSEPSAILLLIEKLALLSGY